MVPHVCSISNSNWKDFTGQSSSICRRVCSPFDSCKIRKQQRVCFACPVSQIYWRWSLMYWSQPTEFSDDLSEHGHRAKVRWQPVEAAINSLSPGKCGCDFKCVNFEHNMTIEILSDIGTGNGLVWSGNEPSPEPMLTKISGVPQYVTQTWPNPIYSDIYPHPPPHPHPPTTTTTTTHPPTHPPPPPPHPRAYMRRWTGLALVQVMACRLPIRRQAITWTNADLLSIGHLGTIFRVKFE